MKKLFLLLCFTPILFAEQSFETRPESEITREERGWVDRKNRYLRNDLNQRRELERANAALDSMIQTAVWKLTRDGHAEEAWNLKTEWEQRYFGYILRVRDVGDFEPLSKWLDEKYKALVELLGIKVVKFFHLDDIWELNYTIPVVIKPCLYGLYEYRIHFQMFTGVIAYWGVYIGCSVASGGAGCVFFCSPLGMLAEHGFEKFLAIPVANRIFKIACE